MQDKMKSLITNIKLDAATFHGETVEPTYINFFFGKNGAGKTTVASAFEDPSCLEWQSGINPTDYTILVYNQEFINRNLANYGDLKGVFTLSKENAETRKQIDDKTEERKTVIADGRQAAEDRDKKNGELKPLRDSFETTCWEDTEDIRRSFDQTQTGKKKKLQFTDEVLSGKHKPIEHKKEDIQKLYDIAYDPKARKYPSFNTSAELEGVYDLTGEHFLAEEVTSRSETQFAQFMKALNATEWVKQGHADYVAGHDEGKCPFCQRKLPDTFEKDIAEAFDEGYQKALDALETFEIEYARKMAALLELLKNNLTDVFPKAKTDEYEKLVAQLETVITENEQLIAKKRTSPGEPVALKDTDAILSDIDTAIAGINKLIQENNDIVATKPDKQLECFNMVWEEIAFILKEKVAAYIKSKGDIEAEVKRLDGQVKALQGKYKTLTSEINTLNASVINTAATVDSINAHLKDSGFEGFRLREKEGVKGTYEVIREDGKVAENLSEGERNFIAFLYFYHLVRGSQTETDSGKDKIVVIDDPTCLQVRIDRDRTDIFESAFLQIPADFIRQAVADRDRSRVMSPVKNDLPAGECPDVIAKTAEFLPYLPITSCVVDYRLHFARGADHAFRIQNTLHILFIISSNPIVIEVIKTVPENLPLFQHQIPGKPALQALQGEMLKHFPVIMHRDSPFRIVIDPVGLVDSGPRAIPHMIPAFSPICHDRITMHGAGQYTFPSDLLPRIIY